MAPTARPVRGNAENHNFPIVVNVEFTLHTRGKRITGSGRTVCLSSRCLVFEPRDGLPPGGPIDFAIPWPARLYGRVALRLCARGRLVRYEGGRAEVEFSGYEFRTSPGAVQAERRAMAAYVAAFR